MSHEPGIALHFLDDALWRGSVFGVHSAECSPLYVDRYSGPRLKPSIDTHEWWELTAVVDGSLKIAADPIVTASKHNLVLVAPGTRHCEESEYAETVWIGFRATPMKEVERRLGSMIVVRSRALSESAEQLWLYARQQGGPIGPELDGLTERLVAAFLRLTVEPKSTDTPHDWIDAAVEHLEHHLTEPVRLPKLAQHFGCSEGHFCRVFKSQTGCTPITYVLRARIERAKHLLQQTNWTVTEIGRAIGFENPFYFSRVFRNLQGLSPRQFRQTQCDLPRLS